MAHETFWKVCFMREKNSLAARLGCNPWETEEEQYPEISLRMCQRVCREMHRLGFDFQAISPSGYLGLDLHFRTREEWKEFGAIADLADSWSQEWCSFEDEDGWGVPSVDLPKLHELLKQINDRHSNVRTGVRHPRNKKSPSQHPADRG